MTSPSLAELHPAIHAELRAHGHRADGLSLALTPDATTLAARLALRSI